MSKYPQVLNTTYPDTEQSIAISLFIPKNLIYFQGHFPGQPILPGVAQVNFAIDYAAQYLGLVKTWVVGLSPIKFLKVIHPENHLILTLQLTDTALNFCYTQADQIYSSGKIKLNRK